jgi:hypothetical protein
MNKFLAAVGIAAVGATALHAQSTVDTTSSSTYPSPSAQLTPQEQSKFWTVSAALRGFYDDNYTALPKNAGPLRSFGVEVSPSLSLNWAPAETLIGASYTYDWKWYEKLSQTDETHQFNGKFIHNFSPRYRLELNDSFVSSSEPTVIDTTVITSPVKRTIEDNIRNRASGMFSAEMTPILDLEIGGAATLYDYRDNTELTFNPAGQVATEPGRAAELDRIEYLASLDLRWKARPDTTGIFGYQFGDRDFTSSKAIAELITLTPVVTPFGTFIIPVRSGGLASKIRNSYSHFLFVGADQSFGPDFKASIRVGGQFVDYYNLNSTEVSPYADANLTYTYLPGSYVQVGVKHEHAATDILGDLLVTDPNAQIVKDQEATTVYGAVTHKITAKLVGSVLGQYQHSVFNGGGPRFDGQTEDFFTASLNLGYQINPYLLAETGYSYDKLDSKFGRDYTRNRVYVGVRATY